MAPNDLTFTVDFNDASFEDENADPYIPETWMSNRDSTGNNASMAVLGAGSEAAEFVFDFDDANFDSDPDSDIGIESDMEGGSRVLRVDTSDDQGSFKFSSIPGDTHSVGTTPTSFYGNVEFSGNAALGVTDAFLANINNPLTNPGLSSNGTVALDKDSPVHVGAVAGATAMLTLGKTASGKADLNFNSTNTFAAQDYQVYKQIGADGSTGHFVAINMGGPAIDKTGAPIGDSIAFVPVQLNAGTGNWSPAIENDGWVYTGRGGNIDGVQSQEKVWINLDAIGMTFGPETNAQDVIDGDNFGIELVGDGITTVDIGNQGTATKFGILVDKNLYVDGVTEIKLNDGGANVQIEADGIVDNYTLVSGSGDDLIDFRDGGDIFNSYDADEDYVALSYQDHDGVRLTLADMDNTYYNGGFTLKEQINGYPADGDRVKGAVIDEIILSDGSDIVSIEGSAVGAGAGAKDEQVLRPGYAGEDGTTGIPFTNVMLENVEIIKLEGGSEYHLLQGGTGTLQDFYYYASNNTADISGLGDDRQHIVYRDSDHNGNAFDDNGSTGQEFVWIDTRDADGKGHRFEMAV